MKRKLLFTVLLCVSAALHAQQKTATFVIAKNQQNNYYVTGDASSSYDAITFQFPAADRNIAVNFANTANGVNIFSANKTVGTNIGQPTANGNNISITADRSQQRYLIDGFPSNPVPQSFSLLINGQVVNVFHLNAFTATAGNQPKPVAATPAARVPVPPTVPTPPTPPSSAPVYKPGNLLKDAIYIAENADNPSKQDTVLSILKSYNVSAPSTLSQNAYLDSLLSGLSNRLDGSNTHSGTAFNAAGLLSTIGSMDVTNVADGFAKFIVERTKQELNVAFFNNFYKALQKPEYADLRSVFPQTYSTLSVIGDQIYMYNAYIQTLRESFDSDLSTLPEHLPSILENHAAFFNERPDLKSLLTTSFYLADKIENKEHPGKIIHEFPVNENLVQNNVDTNTVAGFKTMQLVSKSMQGTGESDHYWAPEEDVKKLFTDGKTLIAYLGLLEQRAKNEVIQFRGNGLKKDLWRIIDSAFHDQKYQAYTSYLKAVYSKMQSVEAKVESLKSIQGDSARLERYASIVSASIDLMEQMSQAERLPHFPQNLKVLKNTKQYFYMVREASDLVIDVNKRNYASAIVDAVALYDTIFTPTTLQKDPDLAADCEDVKEYFFKYGSFMSNIVSATNSDEVEAAIEAVALPAGSSSVKRQSAFNVSLNAYCGLYGGYERIKGIDAAWLSGPKSFANSYGVTAPIGVAISWGCHGWSNSVFLSMVDIGALTAFRFTDDSTETVPNIRLQNIVSPGVFYSLGIKNTPLSVNLGWQMGPLLRNVTAVQNDYSQSYSRVSLSLCVDLPLMNFYTKPALSRMSKTKSRKR